MRKPNLSTITTVVLGLIVTAGSIFLCAFMLQICWNYTIPRVFYGLVYTGKIKGTINIYESLMLLCSVWFLLVLPLNWTKGVKK